VDTTLCQQCSEELLAELKRTLTAIPENSVLLLTCSSKPDGRLKLQSLPISEFFLDSALKTEQLHSVQQVAQELGIKLTQRSAYLVAESVTIRQLYSELENCVLLVHNKHLDVDSVAQLVQAHPK